MRTSKKRPKADRAHPENLGPKIPLHEVKDPVRAAEFARLEGFLEQALRGTPIETIAVLADARLATAVKWRQLRNIKPGLTPHQESVSALELFSREVKDHLHRCEESPVGGVFTPPQYVLRQPLEYAEFCRAAHALHTISGFDVATLSRALGVRATDVDFALKLWTHHLTTHGVPCASCGRTTEPERGAFCSRLCMESSDD